MPAEGRCLCCGAGSTHRWDGRQQRPKPVTESGVGSRARVGGPNGVCGYGGGEDGSAKQGVD